jgi:protein gp37
MVFVNSMSDLFHEDVPFEFITAVFGVMAACPQHTFQVLTKRPERMIEFFDSVGTCPDDCTWPLRNVWLGVTVESSDHMYREDDLQKVPAEIRFISMEPLLGPVPRIPLGDIDWVIVGAETGPGARPMKLEWARDIRDQCREAGVPFFMKKVTGGGERPADLQIREDPIQTKGGGV